MTDYDINTPNTVATSDIETLIHTGRRAKKGILVAKFGDASTGYIPSQEEGNRLAGLISNALEEAGLSDEVVLLWLPYYVNFEQVVQA